MSVPSPDSVHVFDTWVQGRQGTIHFDVMTTDQDTALRLAHAHLAKLGESGAQITVKECQFCHTEPLAFFNAEQQRQFQEQGGFILELPA